MRSELHNPNFISGLLIKCSLFYLALIACIGIYLRIYSYFPVRFSYTHFLHAHSHGAFLGWIYLCICGLFIRYYFKDKIPPLLSVLLIADIVVLFAMIISFILQGYGAISIALSAIHIFISWYCAVLFIRKLKIKFENKFNAQKSFLAAANICMIVSGIFPLLLGLVIHHYGPKSIPYYNFIYTYLHFQYNGYFIFTVVGFVFHNYSPKSVNDRTVKISFVLLLISGVLLLANSWLWASPAIYWYYVSIAGGCTQLVSFIILSRLFHKHVLQLNINSKNRKLIYFLLSVLGIKVCLQLASSFPGIAQIVAGNRYLIIFYLHLVFIGIVSIPMLGFLNDLTIIKRSNNVSVNMKFIMFGFIGSEITLLYKGIESQFNSNEDYFYPIIMMLFSFTLVMALLVYSRRLWKSLI